jgi:hypothetical protein
MSLFLMLITLYVSLMVLNTASRLIYSFIFGMIRMAVMGVLILGVVWVIKAGQGDIDTVSNALVDNVQWVMDQGKRYIWNAAGDLLNW